MQPSLVCTASAWVLGEPHVPGRSRGSRASSCSGKALASGWGPQPERAQRGGAAGTATPLSRERQLGQVSGRSRRAGVLRPCPRLLLLKPALPALLASSRPSPGGILQVEPREAAATEHALRVGTARVLLHPALSPRHSRRDPKGWVTARTPVPGTLSTRRHLPSGI